MPVFNLIFIWFSTKPAICVYWSPKVINTLLSSKYLIQVLSITLEPLIADINVNFKAEEISNFWPLSSIDKVISAESPTLIPPIGTAFNLLTSAFPSKNCFILSPPLY